MLEAFHVMNLTWENLEGSLCSEDLSPSPALSLLQEKRRKISCKMPSLALHVHGEVEREDALMLQLRRNLSLMARSARDRHADLLRCESVQSMMHLLLTHKACPRSPLEWLACMMKECLYLASTLTTATCDTIPV